MVRRLKALNERRRTASIRDLMFSSALLVTNANLAALASGCVLLLAAQSMRLGHFTIGDFTLFATYLGMVAAAPGLVRVARV